MPLARRLLGIPPRIENDEKVGARSPTSSKSPRTPKSPKSPKSPLSKTHENHDYLNQCAGCDAVEILIERSLNYQRTGLQSLPNASVVLHNSFAELDECALKCQICRMFRQALMFEEITYDGMKTLRKAQGRVVVRWQEAAAADGGIRICLRVETKGEPVHAGVINCSAHKDIEHLALHTDALSTASIGQAREWMNTCLNSHKGRCDNLGWSSAKPRFLINILSKTSIRLCENTTDDYVALSYCWGDVPGLPQPEKDKIELGKTYLANLDRRRRPFLMSELPATVQDALRIILAMDIKYAWVDTVCITQDKKDDMATMHKVYSNALFTLCACATTKATSRLLDQREAWTRRTEPCRLGGQWLTTPDMSLNELRLRSPLAKRGWTLQEERLSPRMLYVSGNRMHWSCAMGDKMEMKPTYDQKIKPLQRPVYAALARDVQMPPAQEFLMACYAGRIGDLHGYWTDIVTSYAWRDMGQNSDRLTALSGLAVRYLSARKNLDEYLAGLWANNLAEGLAWRVHQVVEPSSKKADPTNMPLAWPSWSWAGLPLQTKIGMNANSKESSYFEWIGGDGHGIVGVCSGTETAVKQGEHVKNICVTGRMRPLWQQSSCLIDWSTVSDVVDGEERFSFAANPELNMHAVQIARGRLLVYEDRKREVVVQLDFRRDVQRLQSGQLHLWVFELGASTLLVLECCPGDTWRRVGAAWDVREDFFAPAHCNTIILH